MLPVLLLLLSSVIFGGCFIVFVFRGLLGESVFSITRGLLWGR